MRYMHYCPGCHEPVRIRSTWMDVDGKRWHVTCAIKAGKAGRENAWGHDHANPSRWQKWAQRKGVPARPSGGRS